MSGRISQLAIDDLLARTDIVDIIQPRINLVKKGQNYQARCPFHDEKTPSFTVSPSKQFYYCFGCGAHGNAINFLMNFDRMEFLDALSYLAAQAGIELDRPSRHSPPEHLALYTIMEAITQYYQKNLRQSPEAISYLKSRGFSGKSAKNYRIGYATSGWNQLEKQHDLQSLVTTGMVIKKVPNKTYDRFRHRIMFPIRDLRGRIIAFGGRGLGDGSPKYLNSPATPIFHKSNTLYGLYEARQARENLTRLIIVEGYLDVIALSQYGIPYAVATLGTAVNTQHLQTCLRYSNELVFCFDGDDAGWKAAWTALTIALPLLRDTIQIRFLFLPEGEDPDSLIQKIDKTSFESLIEKAESLSSVFFNTLDQQLPRHSLDAKAHYAHKAMQYLNTMPKGMFYQLMQKALAKHLKINFELLEQVRTEAKSNMIPFSPTKSRHQQTLNPAQLASALLLQQPQLAKKLTDLMSLKSLNTVETALLVDLIIYFSSSPESTAGTILASTEITSEQKEQIAALAATELLIPTEGVEAEFYGAIDRLEERYQQQQISQLIQKAKTSQLSDEEKEQLQQLLADKSKTSQDEF